MKKMISLLLALVLVLSLIPVMASASDKPSSDTTASAGTTSEPEKAVTPAPIYYHAPNNHDYDGYDCNTAYHWMVCACGCKINMEPHIDPKDAKDDYCICGYHFSDDADLVVLWIDGCPGIKKFDKNTTEYKLNVYTYKDVKEIRIVTKTNDSEATVELPEDLTLKSGENKFEIKVTSENQKVTKVYTVTVVK